MDANTFNFLYGLAGIQNYPFVNSANLVSNGAVYIPAGNTSQRPNTSTIGAFRYNVELFQWEGLDSDLNWLPIGGGAVVIPNTYVQNTDSRVLSGNLEFSGANVVFDAGWKVGSNIVATTSSITFGNSTVNTFVNSTQIVTSNVILGGITTAVTPRTVLSYTANLSGITSTYATANSILFIGQDNATGLLLELISANTLSPSLRFHNWGNTFASPTNIANGIAMVNQVVLGSVNSSSIVVGGRLRAMSAEAWSTSNTGMYWLFQTTKAGTNTIINAMNIGAGVSVTATGTSFTDPGSGNLQVDSTVLVGNSTVNATVNGTLITVSSNAVLANNTTATIGKGFTLAPFNAGTKNTGTFTPDPTQGNYQYFSSNGAFTLAAPSSDCAIDFLITNGTAAGTITFSGYAGGTHGDSLTTTSGNQFILSIRRINGTSMYLIKALQ